MTDRGSIEAIIADVARQCGVLVVECADVGGHVSVASDQIDQTIADLDGFDLVADALAADHARVAAAIAEARILSEQAKQQLGQGAAAIADSFTSFGAVSDLVERLSARLSQMADALERVQGVSQLIGGIAQQTNMLALNAAIEAARAGQAGSAFAIVATEVKRLAQHTREATQQIDRTVGALVVQANAFTDEIKAGSNQGHAVAERFSVLRDTVADIQTIVTRVDEQTDGIAESNREMHRSIAAAQQGLSSSAHATRKNGMALRAARVRLEGLETACNLMLDQLAGSGVTIDDSPLIDTAVAVGRELTQLVEGAIRRGEVSIDDVFDTDYRLIPGTNPEQHTNRFCDFADRHIRPVLDRVTHDVERSIGCVVSDANGYLPTHLTLRSQPQGADPEWNNTWSRNRRQMGLDDCMRRALASTAPAMLNCYRMKLGHNEFLPLKNVFVPLWFEGRRWGNFELAYLDLTSAASESITPQALEASLARMRRMTA